MGNVSLQLIRYPTAVDTVTGAVWCHACQDWVYALAFEGALGRVRRLQEERLDTSVGTGSADYDACLPAHHTRRS